MARTYSIPFETNSLTNGVECATCAITQGGGMSISTANPRTGTYSLKIAPSGGGTDLFKITNSNSHSQFIRIYLYITARPTGSDNSFLLLSDSADGTAIAYMSINTDGSLALVYSAAGGGFTQIGSNSAVLSLNTQYMVDLHVDDTGGTSSTVIEGRLNGTVFATRTGTAAAGSTGVPNGFTNIGDQIVGTNATGTWYVDDVAVNDSSGTSQTTYPGTEALYVLRLSAAGDANAFTVQVGGTAGSTNNFTRVNEVTPDGLTSYNGDITSGDNDEFNIADTPGGIGSSDTINVVHVYNRYAGLSAVSDAVFKARIKKTSGGTVQQGSAITPASTSFTTIYGITAYTDPDSAAWTKATLDTAQIGYGITTTGVNAAIVTNTFLIVGVTPAATTTPRLRALLGVGL